MSDRFKCLTLEDYKLDSFDHALSDILCWMDGFTQGGGSYSPDTILALKDLRDTVRRAYPTCEPQLQKEVIKF